MFHNTIMLSQRALFVNTLHPCKLDTVKYERDKLNIVINFMGVINQSRAIVLIFRLKRYENSNINISSHSNFYGHTTCNGCGKSNIL